MQGHRSWLVRSTRHGQGLPRLVWSAFAICSRKVTTPSSPVVAVSGAYAAPAGTMISALNCSIVVR